MPFLDVIASPSTYPCQWVSQWVTVSDLEIAIASPSLLLLARRQQGLAFIPVAALGGWHQVAAKQIQKLGTVLGNSTVQNYMDIVTIIPQIYTLLAFFLVACIKFSLPSERFFLRRTSPSDVVPLYFPEWGEVKHEGFPLRVSPSFTSICVRWGNKKRKETTPPPPTWSLVFNTSPVSRHLFEDDPDLLLYHTIDTSLSKKSS